MAEPDNLGFAAGNHIALPYASGRYLLLLNPDTELHDGAVSAMLQYMEAHPECAICGPVLIDGEGHPAPLLARPGVGNAVLACFGLARRLSRRVDRHAPAALSGACMLMPSALISEIGFLDTGMHTQEDVDLCLRAKNHGYKLALVETARVTHFEGRSGNVGYVIRRSYESAFHLHRKHTATAGRLFVYLALSVQILLRYLKWTLLANRAAEAPVRRSALAGLVRRLPELWRGDQEGAERAAAPAPACPRVSE
jgi:GT2 family glycosyltransferase